MIANICTVLIVGVYLISSMGYGIHECTCKGAKDVVLPFGKTSCECVHPNHIAADNHRNSTECECCKGCSSSMDACSVMADECCSTVVYALSHEQVNPESTDVPVEVNSKVSDTMPLWIAATWSADNPVNHSLYSGVSYPSGFKNIDICSLQIVSKSQIRI